ncbi:hypothetical protein N8T08_004760 [Aspergillus melleus]|uniref:Uncharacterized protein n=1 Tax=Aspergillus melleus TaxID=138277 RepID=A0ACC3B4B0_9EURO|nr:hypothetical protein N8T08_004760 [Aspergillus melleus]
MSTSEVPLPLGEDQFAFGDRGPSEQNFLRTLDPESDDYQPMEKQVLESIGGDEILGLTIRGFYIWSTISAWVSASGRRRETPSSRSPPWQNSSFWSRSMAALEDWRASQSPQLVYSPANMNIQVYISRNEGERFAMINLLYYLSLIFLHREYVPFIPHSIIRPCGPTDPPLLVQEAPAGWWDHSAQALFSAASNIIQILQQLDQRNVQFQTPFTCFCVFSAASTLLYANAWPYMAPGLDHQLSMKLYSWGSTWLHQASSVWKVSEAWYSTLVFLTQLYSRVSSDPVQFPGVSRDAFLALEENIQRLAGSEPPDSSGLPAANILLTLQRQTQKVSRPTNNQDAKEGLQTTDSVQNTIEPSTQEARQGSLSELSIPWNPNPQFNADYEFLASILSDPSADWIYPT